MADNFLTKRQIFQEELKLAKVNNNNNFLMIEPAKGGKRKKKRKIGQETKHNGNGDRLNSNGDELTCTLSNDLNGNDLIKPITSAFLKETAFHDAAAIEASPEEAFIAASHVKRKRKRKRSEALSN